jgi:hypothetical protein
MTKEFEIDLSIRGIYDDTAYELEAVEEALAEWNLQFPDEYAQMSEGVHLDEEPVAEDILVEEVHVDSANSFLIVS